MTDFQHKAIIEMVYQILKANVEAGKTPDEILAIIAALKRDPTGEVEKMQGTFRLPALDADVLIDGNTVTISNSEGETIQVGADEWEELREKWRFDDVIDTKNGESGMTVYQLGSCMEASRQVKDLEAELNRLRNEIAGG